MKEVLELLKDLILNEEIIDGVVSNLRRKDKETYTKVDIKPVLIRDEIRIQLTYNYKTKVSHENLKLEEAIEKIVDLLTNEFRQGMIFSKKADYQILVSKRGVPRILKKTPTKKERDLSHNRKKEYIIEDGKACDFLIRLGVMNKQGRVRVLYNYMHLSNS